MQNQKIIKNSYQFRDYFFVFMLIANSGMPFFTNQPYIFLFGSFILALFFVFSKGFWKNDFYQKTILFLIILTIGQILTTNIIDIKTPITLIIRWTFPFLVLLIVKKKFFNLYIDILYYLSIISLILFGISIILPNFDYFLLKIAKIFEQTRKSELYQYNMNILIYTIKPVYAIEGISIFKRNSGPFWEPGGFGDFLLIALIINIVKEKRILSKKNTIFLVSIITTWSTTVLTALSLFFLLYGLYILKNKNYRWALIPLIIFGSYFAYKNLPFINVRIENSINYLKNINYLKYEKRARVVSAIVDLKTFSKYPIFGTGRSSKTRYRSYEKSYLKHRNNGITDFLVKYGILFFIFYFYNIRKTFLHIGKIARINEASKYANISLICIFLLGFSEVIFQTSFLIALFYYANLVRNNRVL